MRMKTYVLTGLVIALIGGSGYYLYDKYQPFSEPEKVHVHADFAISINNQTLDLTNDKYQSSGESEKHADIHLHDGDDHVVHRHADGVTFVDFLSSIGFEVSNDCFTNDQKETFCTDTENVLQLYVNKVLVEDISSYITQEEDQILLYFGKRDNPNISDYINSITDESCIYSDTCPERGTAPPESCGLTCEI